MTYEVRPIHVTAVAEIGKAIHPMMASARSKAAPRRAWATR